MPVQSHDLDAGVVVFGVFPREHLGDVEIQHRDDAAGDVEAVEARHREERGAEQAGHGLAVHDRVGGGQLRQLAPFPEAAGQEPVADQVGVLVHLDTDEAGAPQNGQAEPDLEPLLVAGHDAGVGLDHGHRRADEQERVERRDRNVQHLARLRPGGGSTEA